MPNGLVDCTNPAPTFAGITGMTVSATCTNNSDLPGTATTGYTFDNPSNFETSFTTYAQQLGLTSFAWQVCPPSGAGNGRETWVGQGYNSNQQVLECGFTPVNGTQLPTYLWKFPSERTFVKATAGPNTSFQTLDGWFTDHGTP